MASGWLAPRPGRHTHGKETRFSLSRRQGGTQGASVRVRKVSSVPGTRSPDRSSRSESLYRVSYPGIWCYFGFLKGLLVYSPAMKRSTTVEQI